MKNKTLYSLIFVLTLLTTGCSNAVEIPERENLDSSKYTISAAEDTVPANENSVVQIQGSQQEVTASEFNAFKTITLNEREIKLGSSTVYDLASSCNGTMYFSSDFNCYVIEIAGRYSIFAHTQDDANPAAPLKQITFNNVFMEDYSIDFNGITKDDNAASVSSTFGEPTDVYETCNSKNRSWEWKNQSSKETITFNMIWHDDVISEISISGENITSEPIGEPINEMDETTEETQTKVSE